MRIDWIDDRVSLASVVDAMRGGALHALDTEFERIRTFWPRLALIQVALADRIVLIDPLALAEHLPGFGDALHDGAPWLMHSASEDIVALKPLSPKMPTRLFDTQIAAALAGIGTALSYQKLVKHELDVDLAKSETRSDWIRRPLSAEQIEYAADDVLHLQALAARLRERLEKLDRMEWLWQDGARQLAASWDLPYPDNPHHEYRTAHKISLDAQVRLAALLRWRERIARDSDRPRTWVIDNAIAMELAVTPPANGQGLLAKLQTCRAFPRPRAGEVIQLLQDAAPDAAFQPAPAPFDRDTEQRMKKLRDAIDARAAELAIDPSTLCTRRLLEARVRDGRWPADCTPWRVAMLEPLARAALA